MNQIATQQERTPMDSVGMSTGSSGAKIAPQNLAEVVKFAEVMCRADIALPKHLRGNAGACMAVSLQALDWQMNPFAVASKSYSVNGTIAYEAQLIIAVINTRSGIEGRLEYSFEGEGAERVCIASGKLDGKIKEVRSPKFKDITPKNSPLWKSDPDQQHCYYTGRSWGRRHTPEVILGVYDRDEVEEFRGPDKAKNITPAFDPLSDEPIATQQVTSEREVTGATDTADEPHDALTGEIIDNTNTDEAAPSSSLVADEAAPSVSSAEPETSAPKVSGSDLFPTYRADLIECCRKLLSIPAMSELDPPTRRGILESSNKDWKAKLPAELHEHVRSFSVSADAQIKAPSTKFEELRQSAFEHFSEVLDCTVEELGG